MVESCAFRVYSMRCCLVYVTGSDLCEEGAEILESEVSRDSPILHQAFSGKLKAICTRSAFGPSSPRLSEVSLDFTSVCAAPAQVPRDTTFLPLMGSQSVLPYGGR